MTILWGDESVEGVVASDDFAERLGPGGVHVSMSTISPEACGRLAALHARHGSHFVEAPLFGRPATALTKQMFVPVCGPQAAKDRVRPVLEAMGARGVYDFGEQIGAAATVKLVGNYLLICAGTALNEGLTIVKKSGFDQQAALDMLTATLFPGPIYQNYGRMLSEPAQAMNQSGIPLKDLSIFMDMARDTATAAPLLEQLRDLLKVPT
jgi:3-hydroxyisobutyrate dehydrogenase-like beta-hydroxyacid dehydrogenase